MRATDRFSPVAARTAAVVVGIFLCGTLCLAQAPAAQRKPLVADVLGRFGRLDVVVNERDTLTETVDWRQ